MGKWNVTRISPFLGYISFSHSVILSQYHFTNRIQGNWSRHKGLSWVFCNLSSTSLTAVQSAHKLHKIGHKIMRRGFKPDLVSCVVFVCPYIFSQMDNLIIWTQFQSRCNGAECADASRAWYQHCNKWPFLLEVANQEWAIYNNVDINLYLEAPASFGKLLVKGWTAKSSPFTELRKSQGCHLWRKAYHVCYCWIYMNTIRLPSLFCKAQSCSTGNGEKLGHLQRYDNHISICGVALHLHSCTKSWPAI